MTNVFDKNILCKRITESRIKRQINQAQLAEMAGVTPAAISQIENGLRTPTIPVLNSIATVLEVSLDYLIGKSNESELKDLLQHNDIKTFYRGYSSLGSKEKEVIKKHIEFLKSQDKRGK